MPEECVNNIDIINAVIEKERGDRMFEWERSCFISTDVNAYNFLIL